MCAGNKIYRTGVESTTALTNIEIVATLPATPTWCKASAQGDKVALRMDPEGCAGDRISCPGGLNGPQRFNGRTWVVNIDGSGLHELTSSASTYFAWSPDGKFVAITGRDCRNDPLNTQPTCRDDLHVVSWDADKINLLTDNTGQVMDSQTGFVATETGEISWH
jgi:hypothetical protein